jgi:hypothetical protein
MSREYSCFIMFSRNSTPKKAYSMKSTHRTKSLLALLAAATLGTAAANAAVTIQSSFDNNGQALAPTENAGLFSYTFTNAQLNSFTAAGTGKLVFGYTSRYNTTGQGGALPTTVSYGGVNLVELGKANVDRGTAGMWYLDNVASDGNLVINFGTNGLTSDVGFSIFALDGLVSGGPTAGAVQGNANTPTINFGAGGGFVLQTAARNNQSLTADSDYTVDFNYSNSSAKLMSQHLVTQSAGDVTPGDTNGARVATFAWAAAAIPEPSTALLGGLGLLALLRRRR